MDHRERVPHARGVYSTQDTSRMVTEKVKQEKKNRRYNYSKRVVRNMEGRNVGTKRKVSKQRLKIVELTLMLPEDKFIP